MNKKVTLLFVGIIFIILCIFSGGNKDSDFGKTQSDISLREKIRAIHSFEDGTHTLTGEINLPTLCHTLIYKIISTGSSSEHITVAFSKENNIPTCKQFINPEPFSVVFPASKDAILSITLDKQKVPFVIIEKQKSKIFNNSTSATTTSTTTNTTTTSTTTETNIELEEEN